MLSLKLSYFCQVYEKSSFVFLLSNTYIPLVLNNALYSTCIIFNKHVHYHINKSTLILWSSFLIIFSSMLWCLRIKNVFDISENKVDSDMSHNVYPQGNFNYLKLPQVQKYAIKQQEFTVTLMHDFSPKIFFILWIQVQVSICMQKLACLGFQLPTTTCKQIIFWCNNEIQKEQRNAMTKSCILNLI